MEVIIGKGNNMPKCKKQYKDMDKFHDYWKRWKTKYYSKHKKYDRNSYVRWTDEEKAYILAHEKTDVEMAKELGRSLRAVQAMREKLKKEGWKYEHSDITR